MNFKTKKESAKSAINMTPLLDMVFILLIFFAVTTSFINKTGFDINLKEAETGEPLIEENIVKVLVTKDGTVIFKDMPVSMEELKALLKNSAELAPDAAFLIEADENARHGTVIGIIDVGKSAGYSNFSIVTVEKD